jgi:hypothetical protein
MRLLLTLLLAAALFIAPGRNNSVIAPPATSDENSITVIASGTGTDEKGALKQAFSNAISQAIGTIVDAETVIKNDKIITDQVLTASNAIISHYDPVGAPKTENGLVTVKIHAVVERKQLVDRLTAASVISKSIEGKDLFAQAVTDLHRETDATAIVRRIFDGFPGNVLKAEPVGQPRVVKNDGAEVTIGITV